LLLLRARLACSGLLEGCIEYGVLNDSNNSSHRRCGYPEARL
jgi:hypothetical protein